MREFLLNWWTEPQRASWTPFSRRPCDDHRTAVEFVAYNLRSSNAIATSTFLFTCDCGWVPMRSRA